MEDKSIQGPKLPEVEFKIKMPKSAEILSNLKLKLKEYARVLKITKKPNSEEYKAIVKASGIGIIIIGAIGFIIHMIVQGLGMVF